MEPPPPRPTSNHHHHYHLSSSAHPTTYNLNHTSQTLHRSSQSLHHSTPNIHENQGVHHESPIHPPVSTICPRHGNNTTRNGSSKKKILGMDPPATLKSTKPKEKDTKEIMKKRRERAICIVSIFQIMTTFCSIWLLYWFTCSLIKLFLFVCNVTLVSGPCLANSFSINFCVVKHNLLACIQWYLYIYQWWRYPWTLSTGQPSNIIREIKVTNNLLF